jgi:hypothetical protein
MTGSAEQPASPSLSSSTLTGGHDWSSTTSGGSVQPRHIAGTPNSSTRVEFDVADLIDFGMDDQDLKNIGMAVVARLAARHKRSP